jgi:hypothetical protein
MKRVLVCGDRNWKDYNAIHDVIKDWQEKYGIDIILEGEAQGADTMARAVAMWLDIPFKPFPAEWKQYGKAAGPIRNKRMLDEGKPDVVLAFHDDLDNSLGTKNMITIAKEAGVKVWHYRHFLGVIYAEII